MSDQAWILVNPGHPTPQVSGLRPDICKKGLVGWPELAKRRQLSTGDAAKVFIFRGERAKK